MSDWYDEARADFEDHLEARREERADRVVRERVGEAADAVDEITQLKLLLARAIKAGEDLAFVAWEDVDDAPGELDTWIDVSKAARAELGLTEHEPIMLPEEAPDAD